MYRLACDLLPGGVYDGQPVPPAPPAPPAEAKPAAKKRGRKK